MKTIPKDQTLRRLQADNPWWENAAAIRDLLRVYRPRAYFEAFFPLVVERSVRRAIILMGPRRVGKTVMLWHTVQALLNDGINPKHVCYISVDHPLYTGCGVEELIEWWDY